ncbi:MAG: DUF4920 domain-containing protein [Deltaproteobacteria bacterium]|nr:DUF4920 domain-containing protein [Deltaproteobacteria bacterium]MCW5802816.1 DUF4920 domain-containing protein [Deltaproteobacteria bacterium]
MKASILFVLATAVAGAAAVAGCDKGPPASANAETKTAEAPTTPSKTPAPAKAVSLGAGVKVADATPIDKLLADPSAFKGKTVRVEGMITDVCPKRGCWMDLAGDKPGQKLKFKVTDGEMVFPMDAKGKWAVAEGVVAVRELSLEETKAKAEYEAKEYGKTYDPASITGPSLSIRIDGTGAQILDRRP